MKVTIPCPCPPKADGTDRHESDTVTLRAVIDFPTAVLLQKTIQAKIVESRLRGETNVSSTQVLALMSRFYVSNCIEAWTLCDEKGKPVAVTPEAIVERLESNIMAALAVVDAADDAYAEVVLPLAMRAFAPFLATPTTPSTSAKTSGSRRRPKPSKPSSISTTGTDGIATITPLLDGGSSSSLSSGTGV